MSWAKLDDAYPSHPKMLAAGLDALGFDVCGICYCSKYLTDGFISEAALAAVYPPARNPRKLADKLVEVGRWEREEGGYRVRDYHDYNPTRASVETEREQARKRMRERRANKSRSSGEHREKFANGRSATPTRPDPTRPDPGSVDSGSSPPTDTNGRGGGVDFQKLRKALLLGEWDWNDVDAAIQLLKLRLRAGESISSPAAWTEAVVRSMAEKREAAAKADESWRVVLADGSEMVHAQGRWWEPDEWEQKTKTEVAT